MVQRSTPTPLVSDRIVDIILINIQLSLNYYFGKISGKYWQFLSMRLGNFFRHLGIFDRNVNMWFVVLKCLINPLAFRGCGGSLTPAPLPSLDDDSVPRHQKLTLLRVDHAVHFAHLGKHCWVHDPWNFQRCRTGSVWRWKHTCSNPGGCQLTHFQWCSIEYSACRRVNCVIW